MAKILLFLENFAGSRFLAIFYDGQPNHEFVKAFNDGLDEAKGFLDSRINDLSERIEREKNPRSAAPAAPIHSDSQRIFVVHGHDHGNKETIARFLGYWALNRSSCMSMLMRVRQSSRNSKPMPQTCDARKRCKIHRRRRWIREESPEPKEFRARQNVILELGYFVGKLGRAHTFALVEKASRCLPISTELSTFP